MQRSSDINGGGRYVIELGIVTANELHVPRAMVVDLGPPFRSSVGGRRPHSLGAFSGKTISFRTAKT